MPPVLCAVTCDWTTWPPTVCVSKYVLFQLRSRRFENESPTVARPNRPLTPTTGKRAVVLLALPLGDVTVRNSGSYCAYTAARTPSESDAGFRGEFASKSASAPPAASARELSCPPG